MSGALETVCCRMLVVLMVEVLAPAGCGTEAKEEPTMLETEVDLEVVQKWCRNGTAYGTTTTENGAPAVVRYQIES